MQTVFVTVVVVFAYLLFSAYLVLFIVCFELILVLITYLNSLLHLWTPPKPVLAYLLIWSNQVNCQAHKLAQCLFLSLVKSVFTKVVYFHHINKSQTENSKNNHFLIKVIASI